MLGKANKYLIRCTVLPSVTTRLLITLTSRWRKLESLTRWRTGLAQHGAITSTNCHGNPKSPFLSGMQLVSDADNVLYCIFMLFTFATDSLWCRQSQQSFNTSTLPFFIFSYSLHVSAPMGHPQVRYTIDVSKDYSYYYGSVVRTQLDVCPYWYFDSWSPIHVIKRSIKVVKTLIFTVTGLIYKI
jgi:hypothetical protein